VSVCVRTNGTNQTKPTQLTPFTRLSMAMKNDGNKNVIPILTISIIAIMLIYFMWWGWKQVVLHEKRDERNETGEYQKKKKSIRDYVNLFFLFLYTVFIMFVVDFVFVFFIEESETVSRTMKTIGVVVVAQVKSTLLQERWIAETGANLLKPTHRFNFLVFTMSMVVILNSVVVPAMLVLLLNKQCFGEYQFPLIGSLKEVKPHVVEVVYRHCTVEYQGFLTCPNPNYPDNGYTTVYQHTVFEYPWRLSDQCFSAVLQTYSPVVILSLVFSDILQPACWWLATDHSSRAAKVSERSTHCASHENQTNKFVIVWLARSAQLQLLTFGVFVTAALPLISSNYGDRFDTYSIGERWFMCLMISAPIIVFGGLLKRLGKRRQAGEFDDVRMGPIGRFFLRRESLDGDEEVKEEEEHTPTSSFYLPNLDFCLDIFGYNFDEEMLLNGKESGGHWPLYEHASGRVAGIGTYVMDLVFKEKEKANDEGWIVTDEAGEEEQVEGDELNDVSNIQEELEEPLVKKKHMHNSFAHHLKTAALVALYGGLGPMVEIAHVSSGRDLAKVYAELTKTLAIALTFGLASPVICFVACIGICCRAHTLRYLVMKWDKRVASGEVEEKMTEGQSLPWSCVKFILGSTVVFFSVAAILSGVGESGGDETAIIVTLVACLGALLVAMGCLKNESETIEEV